MIYFLGWIPFLLLILISTIHFYWAVGGEWEFDAVLPTKEDGERVLNPKWIDSLSVGIVLGFVSLLLANKLQLIEITFLSDKVVNYSLYFVAIVFVLRAVGDFKYLGFFKKVKNTRFAKNDTQYFSPLCLLLSVTILLI